MVSFSIPTIYTVRGEASLKNIEEKNDFDYALTRSGAEGRMDITLTEEKERTTVRLRGDIYVEQGDELMKAFNSLIKKKPNEVVIDLSELHTITSSGIGKIVLLYKELGKNGGKIRITGVNNTIMQIFKIVKLDKLMTIEPR
jgi:anti-sigma B factor antagonist